MMIDPDRFEAIFLSWARGLTRSFAREVVAIDGNHGRAHKAVAQHFARICFDVGGHALAFDGTHGRLVRCRVFASSEAAALPPLAAWPGLRTVLAVETIRSIIWLD